MFNVLDQLHQDHINVAILLDLIDQQVAAVARGEDPDYDRLVDIMRYMTEYPDIVHHPREDLVFEKLIARDRAARSIIEGLTEQHRELARTGNAALEALLRGGSSTPMPREEIAAMLAEYSGLLREHMNKEEGQVFPLARLVLTDADIAEIDATPIARADPMFGESVEHSYRSLFEFIVNERPQVDSGS